MQIKFSRRFEEDYTWYLRNKDIYTFSGTNLLVPNFHDNGYSAKECFYLYDSRGKLFDCREPDLFSELLRCKQSINLQIKIWAECISDLTLFWNELYELDLLPWMIKAIDKQIDRDVVFVNYGLFFKGLRAPYEKQ